MFQVKFGSDWPSGFREEDKRLNIMVIYMYIAPGQGQTPPGDNFFFHFININIMSICPFPSSFALLNTF